MKNHWKSVLTAGLRSGLLFAAILFLIYPNRAVAQQGNQQPSTPYNGVGDFLGRTQPLEQLRENAEQGRAYAQLALGKAYLRGDRIPQDYVEAFKWIEKSAEQGYFIAQSELGSLYAGGSGIPRDQILAYKWLSLSILGTVDKQNSTSQEAKKMFDSVSGEMTFEQIDEAKLLVEEWKTNYEKKVEDGLVTPSWGLNVPLALVTPRPSYTEQARLARIDGSIRLRCIVRKNGTASDCKIIQGLGYGLDEATIRIIETKWLFKPARFLDKPVDHAAEIQMDFKIK